MAEDSKTTGNEKSLKSGKGRIQVTLLDDTVVAFQVEVGFHCSVSYVYFAFYNKVVIIP